MRLRFLIFAGVVAIAVILLCLRNRQHVPRSAGTVPEPPVEHAPGSTVASTGEVRFARSSRGNAPAGRSGTNAPGTQRIVKTSYSDAPAVTQLSEPASKAARSVAAFAAAARLKDFDPTVIAYQDYTNRQGAVSGTAISTRTHSVSVRGIVETMTSYFDAERPLDSEERNHGKDRWYQCTGTWTEKEAVEETMAILQRLGAIETIELVTNGGHHGYDAMAYNVKDPDGNMVTVTPFVTVTLYDREMRAIVTAQYRMGANGPAGLTRWHHWPGKG